MILQKSNRILLWFVKSQICKDHLAYFTRNCVNFKNKLPENWGSKKINLYKPLYVEKVLAELDPHVAAALKPFQDKVKEQGYYTI